MFFLQLKKIVFLVVFNSINCISFGNMKKMKPLFFAVCATSFSCQNYIQNPQNYQEKNEMFFDIFPHPQNYQKKKMIYFCRLVPGVMIYIGL